MAKTENHLDISLIGRPERRPVRRESDVRVPHYSLYGDAANAREWFVNVEPLDQRASALDWKIAPHTHPKFTQLVFVGDGAGEMTLDGDTLAFASPCVLVIPPFRIHGFRYVESTSGTVLTIENNYLGELLARAPDLRPVLEAAGAFPVSPEAQAKVAAHLCDLTAELATSRQGGIVGAEVQLLQIVLTVLRDRPAMDAPPLTARAELVDRFLEMVEVRYRDQPDLDTLAAALCVSPAQLRGACRATTGLPPLAILHDRIAAEAKRCLIYTSMSVAEIGYTLGFDDAAYFTRFFTRTVGVTPTRFRQG